MLNVCHKYDLQDDSAWLMACLSGASPGAQTWFLTFCKGGNADWCVGKAMVDQGQGAKKHWPNQNGRNTMLPQPWPCNGMRIETCTCACVESGSLGYCADILRRRYGISSALTVSRIQYARG
jgi:hypothetical protein